MAARSISKDRIATRRAAYPLMAMALKSESKCGGGSTADEGNYIDGEKHGKFTFWYKNGQVEEEYTYKYGKLDGKGTFWYKNGQKKEELNWKNGEVVELIGRWNEDGSVKE